MRITNDRRHKPRVRLGGPAVVHDGQVPLQCECIDLAIGGIGLRSAVKVKKGRKVTVVLALGDRSLALPAAIARCRSERGAWILGLRFAALDADTTAALEAFVETALHRDARMYQAQIFLARTGAKSLDEVLGASAAAGAGVAAAASKAAPAAGAPKPAAAAAEDGSQPIAIDDAANETEGKPRDPSDRAVTGPWAPAPPAATADKPGRSPTAAWTPAPPSASAGPSQPPPPPARQVTIDARPPPPPSPPPAPASDSLRTAVTSALIDLQSELGDETPASPSGDFGNAPDKGGTMIVRNPLLAAPPTSPPSAITTNPAVQLPAAPQAPATYRADVSDLDFEDDAPRHGRAALGTQIVDPRLLAERSRGGAVKPPPLRVERSPSPAAAFKPSVADLELDDAPTQMFADPEPEPAPPPVVKRRSLPGETQIGPAPTREDSKVFDTPPSPFGSGRAREVLPPPSATSTLPGAQVAAPPPVPSGGADPFRATQYGGATQVSTQAPSMPYGPVRGESTQVAIPAQGLPVAPVGPAAPSASHQPPSPFGGGERPPPSPFSPPPPPGASGSTLQPPVPPAIRPPPRDASGRPVISSKARAMAERNAPRRTYTAEEAATRMRPKPAPAHDAPEPDPEFSAQYSRALADLDLESR